MGAAVGLAVGAVAAVAVKHAGSLGRKSSSSPSFSLTSEFLSLIEPDGSTHGLSVANKYILMDGPAGRPSMYSWIGDGETVLEPFHATTFAVTGASSGTYEWTISRPAAAQSEYELDLKAARRRLLEAKGLSRDDIDSAEPEYDDSVVLQATKTATKSSPEEALNLVHAFNELGVHTVSVANAKSGETVTATVHVKYVRREMRNVDEPDRLALFEAWKTIMDTSDSEGVKKYGRDYMSLNRLATEHNNLAGDRACDRLHDGMGFVPGHIHVTRLLEASLQSVDSAVVLPYWEYTIDVEDIIANHDGDFIKWRDIPAFTENWFGHTNVRTGHVDDGLFTSLTLEGNEYTTVSNSWGLIRSPWNNLKDKQFARYFGGGSALNEPPVVLVNSKQMSTCEVVADTIVNSKKLDTFNGAAAGQAHGPIHMFTGGQSNTPDMVARLNHIGLKSSEAIHNQFWGSGVTFLFASIKSLWRYKLYNCPKSCDFEMSEEECACTCSTEEIMNSDAKEALFSVWMKSFEEQGLDGEETLKKMLNLLCDDYHNVVMGDHASSGSTSDPSFWLIHGSVERWLQLIRLNDYFEREDWDMPVFDSNIHPFTDTCQGHHEGDKLVFGQVDGNEFTNGEYYDYMNPKVNNLPYVYDNFHWDHCKALGYDIPLLVTQPTDSSTVTVAPPPRGPEPADGPPTLDSSNEVHHSSEGSVAPVEDFTPDDGPREPELELDTDTTGGEPPAAGRQL